MWPRGSSETSREGTLDRALVVVALDRPTLVDDKMWAGRISEAVASVVPVRVETRAVGVDDVPTSQPVLDHRGHHVGTDRSARRAVVHRGVIATRTRGVPVIASDHRDAAADAQRLAGDVARTFGAQVCDHPRDVVGLTEPAQRDRAAPAR